MTMNLDASDIRTPRGAATFLAQLGTVCRELAGEAEQFRANQTADGVEGKPLEFLQKIQEQLTNGGAALGDASLTATKHANKIADRIGSAGLGGTQAGGGYSDPAAQ